MRPDEFSDKEFNLLASVECYQAFHEELLQWNMLHALKACGILSELNSRIVYSELNLCNVLVTGALVFFVHTLNTHTWMCKWKCSQ